MTCIVNPTTAREEMKVQTAGFWVIINRPINCPTIACTFGTTIKKKRSEFYERTRSSDFDTLHLIAPTTGLVSESGHTEHSVQMCQAFFIVRYSRISNVVSIHCRELCTYML